MNVKRVNIIHLERGNGLKRDAKLIAGILQEVGFEVTINTFPLQDTHWSRYVQLAERRLVKFLKTHKLWPTRLVYRLFGEPKYDINLFLERVELRWLAQAKFNCFIPNQEWFLQKRQVLPTIDLLLCKTHHAAQIFQQIGCAVEFISFTSEDRHLETLTNPDGCLHVAGRSHVKGTDILTAVWSRHPEWPMLTVIIERKNVAHYSKLKLSTAKNIVYIDEFLEDEVLKQYQNAYPIQIYPSRSEGFGHAIVEAMSCGAVVLTTNAPPMNELVSADRGLLVDYQQTQPQGLDKNYFVDEKALEAKITEALAMDEPTRKKFSQAARAWYLNNDLVFRKSLVEAFKKISLVLDQPHASK